MSKWRTQLQLVLLTIECCLLSIYSHHCSLNVEHQLNVTTNVHTLNIFRTQEDGYATDITCEWLLKAPSADHAIRLSITKLDTECSWDRLYLYDGKSFQDKLLGVYSGSMLPRNVYATSGFMLIYFFSDYSGTFTGFQLEYSLTNSDSLEVIGEIDRCATNAECNTQFGLNQCNAVTKKCECQGNYMGLFCELEMFQSRLYSHGWNLLSVNTKAMSRTGHAIAAFSDTLYLFGGYDFTTSHNDLYTSSDMYTFHLVTPASPVKPDGRHSHQMVTQLSDQLLYVDIGVQGDPGALYGTESVYVHGGVLNGGSLSNQLWQYSIADNSWTKLSDSPLAVANHVMVAIDNRWLFTHGGYSHSQSDSPISDMYVYDTKERTWRKENYANGYKPSLRLAGHTAVVSDYIIYVYGGYTQKNARFLSMQNVLWKYDVRKRIWSEVRSVGRDLPPLVFHAAALYNNKMVVYGGSTNSSNQCLNSRIFIFDVSCQQWLNIAGPANDTQLHRHAGQYGHSIHVQDNTLYVYGGTQGSLTYDVISIGLGDIISQSPLGCSPCDKQSTCQSCALLSSCKWCAAESSCTADACSKMFRGNNSGIYNISQCVTEDKPAGWYYTVYSYPANHSQPDEVHLATNSRIVWHSDSLDYVCQDCPSSMLARGHILEDPDNPSTEFWFTAIRNMANLTKVLGNVTKVRVAELDSPVSHSDSPVSSSDVLRGFETGYMQYEASQQPIENTIHSAIVGIVRKDTLSGYTQRHLSPFSSGICSNHLNCYLCATDPACGWCDSQSACIRRSESCVDSLDWLKYSPIYCERCEDFTNCATCTVSKANCGWLPDVHKCVRRGRRPLSIDTLDSCPKACSQRLDCAECIGTQADECIWCSTLHKCLPMDLYQLYYQYGECMHYQSSMLPSSSSTSLSSTTSLSRSVDFSGLRDTCSNCSAYLTCDSCAAGGLFCGWCSYDADPVIGVCVEGDFSGPQATDTCPSIISEAHSVEGEATWSFRECPDQLECLLGRHDCVEHAECIETRASYECHCLKGYKGEGNVSCERTCYEGCVHGTCLKLNATEFRCQCDLGWTGEACDVSCQCNEHASCTQGVGICDTCQHYTTGQFCNECVANSYGDASTKEGCRPCFCNGNADPERQCNSTTGVCNCLHNTGGDQCGECKLGYFGNPRVGEECYECYQGRTLKSNFEGSGNYISRVCHRDSVSDSASLFSWQFTLRGSQHSEFKTGDTQLMELTFQLVSVDRRSLNPVYIYSDPPNSVLNDTVAYARLTQEDVGVVISLPNGHLTVTYYIESPSIDSNLKFKVNSRNCTTDDTAPGGGLCHSPVNCPLDEFQSCDPLLPHVSPRHQHAVGSTEELIVIHGGVTPRSVLLDDVYVIKKNSQIFSNISVSSERPSPRYGHSLTCAENSCYLYGGVLSPSPLTLSNEFWKLTIDTDRLTWTEIEHQLMLPALSGHTMTSVTHDTSVLLLIGGITEQLNWNLNVYVYNNSQWTAMNDSGASPSGITGHSSVFDADTGLLYILPVDLGEDLSTRLYVLDVKTSTWNRLSFDNSEMIPSYSPFSFLPKPGYLARVESLRPQLDSLSLRVYSFVCDGWEVVAVSLNSSINDNISGKTTLAYSHYTDAESKKIELLIVASDQNSTAISSASLPDSIDWCQLNSSSDGSDGSMIACDLQCSTHKSCYSCMSTPPHCIGNMSCVWNGTLCRDISMSSPSVGKLCESRDQCSTYTDCLDCSRHHWCSWVQQTGSTKGFCSHQLEANLQNSGNKPFASIGCYNASLLNTCHNCLTHNFPTSPSYLWSVSKHKCLDYNLGAILDGGHLGNVIVNASSCPSNCSSYEQCSSCLSQPHCGWCSVQGSQSGDGLCLEGSSSNSSLCTPSQLRIDVKVEQWNYRACPLENECLNRHHSCDIRVQSCIDLPHGFECVCKSGYITVVDKEDENYKGACSNYHKLRYAGHYYEPYPLCIPTCQGGCGEQGCCADIDSCHCNIGYVGENCELNCGCYNNSYCPVNDLSNCLKCRHNTTGRRCEYCLPGYTGNPSQSIACVSCSDACNGRSDTCTGNLPTSNSGPWLDQDMRCLACTGNSEGNLCQSCKPGYFLSADNTCAECHCNGHGYGNLCDTATGVSCTCMNNTQSSDITQSNQCDKCTLGYLGYPLDNHQCYKLVYSDHSYCFDKNSGHHCDPLPMGSTAFYSMAILNRYAYYAVHGHKTDSRLKFLVYSGVADIYMSNSQHTFTVTYDPVLGENVVSINQSDVTSVEIGQNTKRDKRYVHSTTTTSEVESDKVDIIEIDCKDKYEIYFRFDRPMIVKLTSVEYRAVVKFPKELTDSRLSYLYVLIKSRAEGTAGSLNLMKQSPRTNMANIFVLFNITLCGLLLLACTAVVFWKLRQLQRIRQLQAIRGEELNAMAERAFSSKMVFIDNSRHQGGASNFPQFNVVPLALEPIANSSAVVATTLMILPGDDSTAVKATMASVLLTWRLSLPPAAKNRDSLRAEGGDAPEVAETTL